MNRPRLLVWSIPALLYLAFVAWYTDFGGPLRDEEIAAYVEQFEALGFSGKQRERILRFMESDTGRQFFMLNAIDYAENPPDVPGAEPGESAAQLMSRYMEHMYAELLKRACHPTIAGNAIHTAMDLVGVDALAGAERWDMGALLRYRSRRTFMEIVTIPETRGRHEFKVAALDKTIAYPIETVINLGDPRLLLAFILLGASALLDLALARNQRPATRPE